MVEQRAGWTPPRLGTREQRALSWLATVEPPSGIVLQPSLWIPAARASGSRVHQIKRLAKRAAAGGDPRVAWYAEHLARLQRRTPRGPSGPCPGSDGELAAKAGAALEADRARLRLLGAGQRGQRPQDGGALSGAAGERRHASQGAHGVQAPGARRAVGAHRAQGGLCGEPFGAGDGEALRQARGGALAGASARRADVADGKSHE